MKRRRRNAPLFFRLFGLKRRVQNLGIKMQLSKHGTKYTKNKKQSRQQKAFRCAIAGESSAVPYLTGIAFSNPLSMRNAFPSFAFQFGSGAKPSLVAVHD
jgi:hypothetical protein